jgi:hypothetical protein
MADISGQQTKIYKSVFINMLMRYWAYRKKYGKEPNIIYINPNLKGDFITLARFNNMRARYEVWEGAHGSPPNYVWIVAPTVAQQPSGGVYVESSFLDFDQTTDYTCGPASSVMALSALGINTTESEMALREWTVAGSGTSHAGIISGCKAEAAEHGITLTVTERNFSDGGSTLKERFKYLGELIADPKVAVIENGMCSGWPTYYKSYKGGHYVFAVKIDLNQQKVWVADPARSATLVYSFQEFANGLAAHSLPSLLILRRN